MLSDWKIRLTRITQRCPIEDAHDGHFGNPMIPMT